LELSRLFVKAVIRLSVRGKQDQDEEIEATVDTGFSGFLVLPSELIIRLGLVPAGEANAMLADGSSALLHVYMTTVLRDREERDVTVLETDSDALGNVPALWL
jgi:clan AA aspartic protease